VNIEMIKKDNVKNGIMTRKGQESMSMGTVITWVIVGVVLLLLAGGLLAVRAGMFSGISQFFSSIGG